MHLVCTGWVAAFQVACEGGALADARAEVEALGLDGEDVRVLVNTPTADIHGLH